MARTDTPRAGVIYAVIGFFAALAAIGARQADGFQAGLGRGPSSGAGSVLAYALVAALVCYALWRLIQAGFDTDRHGTELKGLAIRAGLATSAIVYLTLAAYAWSLHGAASDASEGGASPRPWRVSSAAAGRRR